MEYTITFTWDDEASVWIATSNDHVTVDTKIKSRHMANAIMKQSGIDYKFQE